MRIQPYFYKNHLITPIVSGAMVKGPRINQSFICCEDAEYMISKQNTPIHDIRNQTHDNENYVRRNRKDLSELRQVLP